MTNVVASGKARLICGANQQDFEIVGLSVSKVREAYAGIMNIPPEASAEVNKRTVGGSYKIQEKDIVEFVKPSGSKGEN